MKFKKLSHWLAGQKFLLTNRILIWKYGPEEYVRECEREAIHVIEQCENHTLYIIPMPKLPPMLVSIIWNDDNSYNFGWVVTGMLDIKSALKYLDEDYQKTGEFLVTEAPDNKYKLDWALGNSPELSLSFNEGIKYHLVNHNRTQLSLDDDWHAITYLSEADVIGLTHDVMTQNNDFSLLYSALKKHHKKLV